MQKLVINDVTSTKVYKTCTFISKERVSMTVYSDLFETFIASNLLKHRHIFDLKSSSFVKEFSMKQNKIKKKHHKNLKKSRYWVQFYAIGFTSIHSFADDFLSFLTQFRNFIS